MTDCKPHPVHALCGGKLRRVAAEMRLLDVYLRTGISMSRLSLIEQGRRVPTELKTRRIEEALPCLPPLTESSWAS